VRRNYEAARVLNNEVSTASGSDRIRLGPNRINEQLKARKKEDAEVLD